MKKLETNFTYLSDEIIKAIAILYKDGFRESDVISFKEIDEELEDRVRFELAGTVFFVKVEQVKDILNESAMDDDDDFLVPPKEDGNCDAEYC